MTAYIIPPGDVLWAIPDGGRWHVVNHDGDGNAEIELTGAGISLPGIAGHWWVANSANPNWRHTSEAVAKDSIRKCRKCSEACAYQRARWPQVGSGWRHLNPAHEASDHVGYP
jgi:hypothetical protein